MDPVWNLLPDCDVAYSSSVTTAAVDAYCAGVPVVSVRDTKTLNLSPLRGCEGTQFAGTPEELAKALIVAAATAHSRKGRHDFFAIDSKLPRWRKLLNEELA